MSVTIIPSKPVLTELSGTFRFIDIGVNLTDAVFHGIHHGKKKHEDDFEAVLDRSRLAGVQSMIITGGSLEESKTALSLAAQHGFFATVGCHPTRSKEFDEYPGGPEAYLQALDSLISANLHGKGRVVAIGECGLDYDRTHFAPEDVQRRHFRSQLSLAKKYKLPLFLHSRAAHEDLVNILRDEGFGEDGERKGVVHSFTGSVEEVIELMDMGFHISVNGCSLKTEKNLLAAQAIRPDKLLLETDAPWCSMTSTHASNTLLETLPTSLKSKYFPSGTKLPSFVMGKPVKGRNEPSAIGGVAWVMHRLDEGVPFEEVTEKVYKNTIEITNFGSAHAFGTALQTVTQRTNMEPQLEPDQSPSLIPFIFAIIGLVWYVILWSIGLLGCRTGRRRYRSRPRSPLATAPPDSAPGVSILRPLKGLDANLYENLESTFTQEYPNFEIILSVADEQDQALSVARDLISKYPRVTARIIIGEEVVGVNPKVNNLIRSYREATHDILWVVDSGISVAPGTLARSVDLLESSTHTRPPKKRVALVHHVPFVSAPEGFLGSRIEEAFLNTNHAKMYLAINTVSIESCVVGKSNLYRRSDLERVNGSLKPRAHADSDDDQDCIYGLAAFGKFLAEDNMIASALWHELDLRHDLSCDVAHNAIGMMSLSDYVWRRVRWIRVRKHMILAATIMEPFTENLVASSIAAASLRYLFDVPIWLFLVVHHAAWLWVDLDVYESLAGHPLPAERRWSFITAWCLRELLALPIWFLAMLNNEVIWRGKKYEVLRAGEIKRTSGGGNHKELFTRWRQRESHYQPLLDNDPDT